MTDSFIIQLMAGALLQVLKITMPILGVSIIVGLIVSIFQATTSIQEQTLTFVPKVIAIFLSIIFFSGWIHKSMVVYTKNLYSLISKL